MLPQFSPDSNITIPSNDKRTQYVVAYTNSTYSMSFVMHKWSWYGEYLGNFTSKKKIKYEFGHVRYYKLPCGVGIAYHMSDWNACRLHRHEYIFTVNSSGTLYSNKLAVCREKPKTG